MDIVLTLAIIYLVILIPYRLWITTGKYDYLKKDSEAQISDLKFNNNYYIDQINEYGRQIKEISSQRDEYRELWFESSNIIDYIEDIALEMPDGEFKTDILNTIHPEDNDNYTI